MRVLKYNASGNDFVIFHSFVSKDRSELAKILCDRFNGIGADGLIVLLPFENGLKWEFYNNDGSYAAMCGNGARAALSYAAHNDLTNATDAGSRGHFGRSPGALRGCRDRRRRHGHARRP